MLRRTTIRNKSGLPDAFVKTVVRWAIKEMGVDWPIMVEVRTSLCRGTIELWKGRAYGWGRIKVSLPTKRDRYPMDVTYRKYKHAPVYHYTSRMESTLHLIGHELFHLVQCRKPHLALGKYGERANEIQADEKGNYLARQWNNPKKRAKLVAELRAAFKRVAVC